MMVLARLLVEREETLRNHRREFFVQSYQSHEFFKLFLHIYIYVVRHILFLENVVPLADVPLGAFPRFPAAH